MKRKKELVVLLALIIICFLVELLGGWWTKESVLTWYPKLNKPEWTPPNGAFAPVWTILYLLMAYGMWLVWKTDAPQVLKNRAYWFFSLQLLLNLFWSYFFFSLQNPLVALLDIFLLGAMIVGMIWSFFRVNPMAGFLQIPYFFWVSYAMALNAAIWHLN